MNTYISDKDIKAEEKRLYDEYKKKLTRLKKQSTAKTSSCQVFTKGLLPIYVLYILSIEPSNGNDISHKIGRRTENRWTPSTGGIYPLLKRLEQDELIEGNWDDPDKKFQKIYRITPKGLKEFNSKKAILKKQIEDSLEVFNMIYSDLYN